MGAEGDQYYGGLRGSVLWGLKGISIMGAEGDQFYGG